MSTRIGELYDALIEAGASPDKARAASEAILPQSQAATKTDIAELESRLVRFLFLQAAAIIGLTVTLVKLL